MVRNMHILLFLLALFAGPARADAPCGIDQPCTIEDRGYFLRLPDGWDGQSELPVLLHFHGWGRQGDVVTGHDRIASATRKRGVLLVAPNGRNRTWSFWRPGSADTAFAEAVLADVAARYPIDRARIYVSGYSYGSAMAWRFACETDVPLAALLAIAGTLRQDEDCPSAPRSVRHVHGLDDTVMEFPMGAGGDQTRPVALWRQALDCGDVTPVGAWQARSFLTLTRLEWQDCTAGQVALDIHPGGHFIPHGWIARHLDELLGLPFSYP
ncbi:MAG: PHB depolymerase family esterase [Pseudomonadota bacterium]